MKQGRMVVGGVAVVLALVGARAVWANVAAQGGQIGAATDAIKTITCTTAQSNGGTCSGLLGPNQAIKGFKLISGSDQSNCGLYDAATIPSSGTAGLFDELYESTASVTDIHIWTSPYKLTTNLSIAVIGTSAVCIVYY